MLVVVLPSLATLIVCVYVRACVGVCTCVGVLVCVCVRARARALAR